MREKENPLSLDLRDSRSVTDIPDSFNILRKQNIKNMTFDEAVAPSKSAYKKDNTKKGWRTERGDIYLLCCFHKEKTPSMVIHATTSKYFHCYGCGRSGEAKRLKNKYSFKINFPQRVYYKQLEFNFVLDNEEIPF